MNIHALLPEFVETTYPELTSFDVGMLMSIFPVGFLLSAPFIGDNIGKIGRKNALMIGVVAMAVATLLFGVASFSSDAWTFYFISLAARGTQGVADAIINITVPALVVNWYPRRLQNQYNGSCCSAMGLGICIGPALGALVYTYFDYFWTFTIFSAYILLFAGGSLLMIPSEVNKLTDAAAKQEKQVGYSKFITNKRVISAFVICAFANFVITAIDPVLSIELIRLGMNKESTGLAFTLMGLSFTAGAQITGCLGGEKSPIARCCGKLHT